MLVPQPPTTLVPPAPARGPFGWFTPAVPPNPLTDPIRVCPVGERAHRDAVDVGLTGTVPPLAAAALDAVAGPPTVALTLPSALRDAR